MALVACPTASIGTATPVDATPGVRAFPEPIEENVSFCGFTAESSFGAWSYLIERPDGNVLVDSPRAAGPLLKALEDRGGVETLFLTHRDDVADHEILRKRFSCRRVLHADDVTSATVGVELQLAGRDPVRLSDDLLAIPTPGHTRGHAVLLYRDKYLFTGDHLAWSRRRAALVAFRDACWYSWKEQIRSMESLLDYCFEWVLPGHGAGTSAAIIRQDAPRARGVRGLDEDPLARLTPRPWRLPGPGSPRRSGAASLGEASKRIPDGGRLLGGRQHDDAAAPAGAARLPAPGARRAGPRRWRASMPGEETTPGRGAGGPAIRRPERAPIARKSPASTACRHVARRSADLVQGRRDLVVAFEACAEEFPVVHSRRVRGAGIEQGQVPEPDGGVDVAAPDSDAAGLEVQAVQAARERRVVVLHAGGLSENPRLDVPKKSTRPGPSKATPMLAESAAAIATVSAEEPPSPEPYGTAEDSSRSLDSEISRASSSAPARAPRGSERNSRGWATTRS